MRTGAGERMRITIRALAEIGDVHVVAMVGPEIAGDELRHAADGISRIDRLGRSPRPSDYVLSLATVRPRRLSAARLRAQSRLIAHLADREYDLVWTSTDRAYLAWSMVRHSGTPVVADLVDFEGDRDVALARDQNGQLRHLRVLLARADAVALKRQLGRIASRAAACVISSEVDRIRLGLPSVHVLPNSYHRATRPLGRTEIPASPIFLFVGFLGYGPNSDAARWLVSEVWPQVVAAVPAAQLRIVGRGLAPDHGLAADGVSFVGEVPTMESELARASALLVPLRYGSGTRIKILEAWAHRIPVISTPVGAEGLGAQDGQHLLMAATPSEFATAAERLVKDPILRMQLQDEGLRHYEANFSETAVALRVKNLAEQLMSNHV